ncbi:exonuclease 1 [Eurosta solidaginis]|uniref:exonuclease 1 n=1 Tax=Eurosta solidaginis TaxID=178769 RepID=UPI003530DE56
MGINGLIPFLEKASSKVHLKEIRGSTVAVDTYCWLHKGAFGCAEKLARGEDTDQYVQYCMRYVELLLSYDIKPILVFDGRHLPAKELTERRRRDSRKQSRKLAAELLRAGDKETARSHMRRCVDVTHEMALRVIHECRLRNVDCIVAPYEADAQMAWFNIVDVAQYVITEDSDLTLFGAKRIVFKLDFTGTGLLVEADKLYLAMGSSKERYTFEKFRRMCILSGCDYLDSLPGIGLAKACKFILKTEEDMWKALKKIPSYLNMKNLQVTDDYIEQFLKAEATFRHMYIYNPFVRRMERLHPLSDFDTDERYCSNAGTPIDDEEQALHLALGNLNPFTLKQLDDWHPDKNFGLAQATNSNKKLKRAKHRSIWHGLQMETHNKRASAWKNEIAAATDDKCALHFRKVDFISKTIDEEITENARVEHAKPEEADIFSMYQQEAGDLIEPCAKRPRYSSGSDDIEKFSSCNAASDKIEESLQESATHNTHNPFAIPQITDSSHTAKTAAVCENASLLNILSPKKVLTETNVRSSVNLTSPKSPLDRLQERVTVKSRFFANNINEVKNMKKSVSRDLTAEINSIEIESKIKEQTRSMLYDSPSPKKNIAANKNTSSKCESTELKWEKRIANDGLAKLEATTSNATSLGTSFVAVDTEGDSESKCSFESAITLSDDDDDAGSSCTITSKVTTQTPKTMINLFKSQDKQRLGLSRTSKPKSTAKTLKTSVKSNTKLLNPTTDLLQNQTRLTMFGFKKRPSLK